MKNLILIPIIILIFGYPPFFIKIKPLAFKPSCERNIKQDKVKKPERQQTKYDKLFSYDNYFYKI